MINLIRTDATHPAFIQLVKQLDAYLAEIDGEEHAFYAQFNNAVKFNHVVIATENNIAVACGGMKNFDESSMEIKRMFTAPEKRGTGLAGKILQELETWAKEIQMKRCVLETGKRQPDAIHLYLKSGYSQVPNFGQYAGIENSVCFEKIL